MNSCAASLQLDGGDFLGRLAGFLIGVGEGHGYGADPDESQYKLSHTFTRIPDVAGTHPTSGRQSTARRRSLSILSSRRPDSVLRVRYVRYYVMQSTCVYERVFGELSAVELGPDRHVHVMVRLEVVGWTQFSVSTCSSTTRCLWRTHRCNLPSAEREMREERDN